MRCSSLTATRRYLAGGDRLPLTCTRSGTCCHGKDIRITPWELARLAAARGVPPAVFRDGSTADGGTRIAMGGAPGWKGLRACSLYDPAAGCSVHAARPLACRLYPLGRELRGGQARIIHEGRRFPCLQDCPEVETLPRLSVDEYLAGQGVEAWAAPRDAYLEIAQDLAEGAFVLVFESGLAASGADWLGGWRRVSGGAPAAWVAALAPGWHDLLIAPALAAPLEDGPAWSAAHAAAMRERAQGGFGILRDRAALAAASASMLGAAMLMIHAVGGDATEVGGRWLAQARKQG